ncbi:hypothetical protein PPYR_12144 [Photinus pyralis]|uniref:E3 ubiquitin-protein ligase RNF10 n=2 Tax=Photinus pyralis TaxID=7054 RepID=A0A5N4ADB3_PHOPY|nr:RING finger protein 10 [Photinus pyralis]KAB0795305.1 hypothetical protein PPYR_12144 [Photinus pyralis]
MEKKGSRLVQPSQKVSSTDKKTQDANKLWPRGCRRREPNGGTFPKNETFRKPTPQRSRALDKRPRPRGLYCSGEAGGGEESGLEPLSPELGSVFLQGSKKQSLNHLLNFHFKSDDSHAVVGPRLNFALKHKYKKEQFLQANCQFIVRESADYKAYMNNPDALVDWGLIEQVNISVLDFPSCPICLYPPIAAKMTRCGHIYCWSCILHYLALSDKAVRKCPICYESVSKDDLKSVITIPHSLRNVNDNITFKLMKRARASLIAYPADFEAPDRTSPYSVSDEIVSNIYTKLLTAGRREVYTIIDRERSELLQQLAEDNDCPEKCFIEQALSLLNERGQLYDSQTAHQENVDNEPTLNLPPPDEEGNPQSTKHVYYFYQATDGQHIYMHNINVRMLEHTYGSLEFCPQTITGRILEKETGSVPEDIRKRHRYRHLPATCQYEFAEIQLKAPIINVETLIAFRDEIDARYKRRQRRQREERKREKLITEEENKKMGKFIEANIHLESHQDFPDFQVAIAMSDETGQISPPSERSSSPLSVQTTGSSPPNNCPSFAKMLSTNKSSTPIWPVRKGVPIPINSEPVSEDYAVTPSHSRSFGDVLALALENASLHCDDNGNSRKGAKKKKQKKVLFSTSRTFSGNDRT